MHTADQKKKKKKKKKRTTKGPAQSNAVMARTQVARTCYWAHSQEVQNRSTPDSRNISFTSVTSQMLFSRASTGKLGHSTRSDLLTLGHILSACYTTFIHPVVRAHSFESRNGIGIPQV
jgi:hypothetical protein